MIMRWSIKSNIKKFTVQVVTPWQLALGSVKYQYTLMELDVNELCWASWLHKAIEQSVSNFSSNWWVNHSTASKSCSDTTYNPFKRALGVTILHYAHAVWDNWYRRTTPPHSPILSTTNMAAVKFVKWRVRQRRYPVIASSSGPSQLFSLAAKKWERAWDP